MGPPSIPTLRLLRSAPFPDQTNQAGRRDAGKGIRDRMEGISTVDLEALAVRVVAKRTLSTSLSTVLHVSYGDSRKSYGEHGSDEYKAIDDDHPYYDPNIFA